MLSNEYWIRWKRAQIKGSVPSGRVLVDGLGVGDVEILY